MSSGVLQQAYRPAPERRHTGDHAAGNLPTTPTSLSRNGSTASNSSRKSEPGWLTSMNGIDRSRANSTASQTSHTSSKSTSSGLGKFFGGKDKGEKEKKKKEKQKAIDQVVLTSRHTAAVKSKLALDPQYQKAMRKGPQPQPPLVVGTQNSAHLTAQQQEMRRPHSGSPALTKGRVVKVSSDDMPALTRIISGDEADEQDEWEQLREEWRARKIPDPEMVQVPEGEAIGGTEETTTFSSSATTPEEIPEGINHTSAAVPAAQVVEREGVGIPSAVQGVLSDSEDMRPRPERKHTPIGGRWRKDDKGVWKR